jgi:hypothetical protein
MFKVKDGLNIAGYTLTLNAGVLTGSSSFLATGSVTSSTSTFVLGSNGFITAAGNGIFTLTDSASTTFSRLQFGGTTSSFPALKRNATNIEVKLADDSALASIAAAHFYLPSTATIEFDYNSSNGYTISKQGTNLSFQATGGFAFNNSLTLSIGNIVVPVASSYSWTGSTIITAPSNGNILVTNAAGTAFNMFQFGGTTSSFPALKRSGTVLKSWLADDSGAADFAANRYFFNNGSILLCPADGNVELLNSTSNGFGLLQFGGTTASFPSIKRNASALNFRKADDSADTDITAAGATFSSTLNITGAAATNRLVTLQTASVNRWTIYADNSTESGANVGSNLIFSRYSDTGVLIDSPIAITRSTGGITTSSSITGGGFIFAASASQIGWSTRSALQSAVDGNIMISNNAATSFGLLQLGGSTSSYPAIKRSSAAIAIRLADDSGDAAFSAAGATFSGNIIPSSDNNFSLGSLSTKRWSNVYSAEFVFPDSAGTAYAGGIGYDTTNSLLQFKTSGNVVQASLKATGIFVLGSGVTASFPALKRSGTTVAHRLADDSADAPISAAGATFSGKVVTPASTTGSASVNVPHGTAPTSPVNGDIWTTTSGLAVQINGATQVLGAVSSDNVELWYND